MAHWSGITTRKPQSRHPAAPDQNHVFGWPPTTRLGATGVSPANSLVSATQSRRRPSGTSSTPRRSHPHQRAPRFRGQRSSDRAAACDFVTADTALGKRFYLLFFIQIPTRKVTLAGITMHPTGQWTTQAARNLFITTANMFDGCKVLVCDGAGQFTASFDEIFRSERIKVAKTPPRTPVANCYIERWFGTLRRELLDRTIVWNEARLQRLIDDYVAHYNRHRPHRSLGQQPPTAATVLSFRARSPVIVTTRCNGLIHEYRHAS